MSELGLLEQSMFQLNIAEGLSYMNRAAIDAVREESDKLMLQRDKDKDVFDQAQDYRHGFLQANIAINTGSAEWFMGSLRKLSRMYPGRPIVIELNSPGGSINEGLAMFDEVLRVRAEGHHVTIRVRGEACSMAIILLQAADVRQMGPNSWLMFHESAGGAEGKQSEIADAAELMSRYQDQLAGLLAARSNKPKSHFVKLYKARKDVWWNADESLALGLVDAIA